MAKRRKSVSSQAASILRKAISDGRSDAQCWGYPANDGEDAPRWRASFYWRGIGGEPQWLQDLYTRAYEQSHGRAIRELWASKPAAEVREAKRNAARNRELRWETSEDRERRLLKEKVARLEQEANTPRRKVNLNAHRQPEAAI